MGYKVYYLSDPRIGKPRYYGVTKSTLDKRLRNHYNAEYHKVSEKLKWMLQIKDEGYPADITMLCAISEPRYVRL